MSQLAESESNCKLRSLTLCANHSCNVAEKTVQGSITKCFTLGPLLRDGLFKIGKAVRWTFSRGTNECLLLPSNANMVLQSKSSIFVSPVAKHSPSQT